MTLTDRLTGRTVRLFAPAKLNLGLEVTGRRDDGYHEVVTILQTVTILDTIDLSPSDRVTLAANHQPDTTDNLVVRALNALVSTGIVWPLRAARLTKRIPEAAGLGGGSSDAGAVIAAALGAGAIDTSLAHALAGTLGSDVPFFLQGGTALATGTGTMIERLPSGPRRWYVVVTPDLEIRDKTRAMYRALSDDDLSDGSSSMRQVDRLHHGMPLDPSLLVNAFSRALRRYAAVSRAIAALERGGAEAVMPSGAGPSVFAICPGWQHAIRIARRLPPGIGQVRVCTDAAEYLVISRVRSRLSTT